MGPGDVRRYKQLPKIPCAVFVTHTAEAATRDVLCNSHETRVGATALGASVFFIKRQSVRAVVTLK